MGRDRSQRCGEVEGNKYPQKIEMENAVSLGCPSDGHHCKATWVSLDKEALRVKEDQMAVTGVLVSG